MLIERKQKKTEREEKKRKEKKTIRARVSESKE